MFTVTIKRVRICPKDSATLVFSLILYVPQNSTLVYHQLFRQDFGRK